MKAIKDKSEKKTLNELIDKATARVVYSDNNTSDDTGERSIGEQLPINIAHAKNKGINQSR